MIFSSYYIIKCETHISVSKKKIKKNQATPTEIYTNLYEYYLALGVPVVLKFYNMEYGF